MATVKKWETRDELAAMFMQAIVNGMVVRDVDPGIAGKANAVRAYALADVFLAVGREQTSPT